MISSSFWKLLLDSICVLPKLVFLSKRVVHKLSAFGKCQFSNFSDMIASYCMNDSRCSYIYSDIRTGQWSLRCIRSPITNIFNIIVQIVHMSYLGPFYLVLFYLVYVFWSESFIGYSYSVPQDVFQLYV